MTEAARSQDDQISLERYRALAREVTDPLAAGLLHEIVRELEARSSEVRRRAGRPISGHSSG
jgi:hypothetical protein